MKSIPVLPLEQPVEWMTIPAGQVTIKGEMFGYVRGESSKTFEVGDFYISKHPTTNAQFAQFVAAGGYSQPIWWTQSGWLIKERNGWQYPEGWSNLSTTPSFPVIGVSWFEAVAFCLWLNAVARTWVMLPTEHQWQRAANGTGSFPGIELDGNIMEWSATELNSGQASLDLNSTLLYDDYVNDPDDDWTSPVIRATNYVLRGGSWTEAPLDLSKISERRWSQPHVRSGKRGFRIAYS